MPKVELRAGVSMVGRQAMSSDRLAIDLRDAPTVLIHAAHAGGWRAGVQGAWSHFTRVRGLRACVVVIDELAFFRATDGQPTDRSPRSPLFRRILHDQEASRCQ